MTNVFLFVVCVTLGQTTPPPPDPLELVEKREQALFEQIAPATVFLSSERGFGSGFLVNPDGLILTCAHVVHGASGVHVILIDGREFTGKVVEQAEANTDLALIQISARGLSSVALGTVGSASLRVGSWVGSVGHGRGGVWSFNVGNVSNIYPRGNGRPIFQTQIPLNPGNSGGPIFDRLGRVVGVVKSGVEGSNSINFAIRIDVALETLPKLRALSALLTIVAPKGVPVFVDGVRVGTGPEVVIPAEPKTYEVLAVIGGSMKRMQVKFPETRTVELK